ncbi:MAG: SDR family NAD(P)-dependent oxidoreductase [Methylophilaceae bacterium]
MKQILIIGGSGAIGSALVNEYDKNDVHMTIAARKKQNLSPHINQITYDYDQNNEIKLNAETKFDLIIFATGHLHNEDYKPEKSLKDIDKSAFQFSYHINCVAPLILLRQLSNNLMDHTKIVFLSARVGSISENELGGWYAYRMSKAALNMMIKNLSIELRRKYKNIIVCGMHPGTVDSKLSKPYSGFVKHEIFAPSKSAIMLKKVINELSLKHSGKIYDYAFQEIAY